MKTATTNAEKLTEFARQASENSQVFVDERDGVYFVCLRTEGGPVPFRTLMGVALARLGVRNARKEITAYFKSC